MAFYSLRPLPVVTAADLGGNACLSRTSPRNIVRVPTNVYDCCGFIQVLLASFNGRARWTV